MHIPCIRYYQSMRMIGGSRETAAICRSSSPICSRPSEGLRSPPAAWDAETYLNTPLLPYDPSLEGAGGLCFFQRLFILFL